MTITRLLALLVLPILLLAPPGALAQDADPPASALDALTPEQAGALSDLLRNEAARDALVAELDRLAGGSSPPPPEASSGPSVPTGAVRGVAERTRAFVEQAADNVSQAWRQIADAPELLANAIDSSPGLLATALQQLGLLVLVTYGILLALRRPVTRAASSWPAPAGTLSATWQSLGLFVLHVVVLGLAWLGGYLVATIALGTAGDPGLYPSLYLNAFVSAEALRIVLRRVLAPDASGLRPIHMPDAGARVLNRWLGILIALVGYGHMLAVPVVADAATIEAGHAVSALVALVVVVVLVWLVLGHRRQVAAWLSGSEDRASGIARLWYVPALLYPLGVLTAVVVRPGDVLVPLLDISAKLGLTLILALVANSLVNRLLEHGIRVPQGIGARLPMLESRLNRFLPRLLRLSKLVVLVGFLGVTADLLGLFPVRGWLAGDLGVRLTADLISVLIILSVAFVIWLAVNSWIDYRISQDGDDAAGLRERTLLALLRNAVNVTVCVIALMFVLSDLGFDIAPLLASAGVLGLAIGFGAQKLVQDIITGIFIQLENVMNVGETVTAGGTTGTVERLTVRSVSLRDLHGTYHVIPFSSVDMVSNYMRDFSYHVADMGIAYREDIDEARQAMQDCFEALKSDAALGPLIVGELEWFGVQTLGDSAVVLRARIKCRPGQQWGIGRAYNELMKKLFDERGIEIPFPHQTIYFGELKDGTAPPAFVRLQGGGKSED